jgi:hypothetical protein
MRAKRSLARQIGEAMSDEQGKFSIGRLLLVLHITQNWVWVNAIMFDWITPADSDVLNLLIGSLDVTIFMVLGAWVIGPRSFQYLFPQIGKAIQGAGGLVGRLKGTDNVRTDDER